MSQVNGHERASAERRMAAVKQAIYELALEQISEGVRAERLRALTKELGALKLTLSDGAGLQVSTPLTDDPRP